MFGLLNIHKPPGPTSHDVVERVRRAIGGRRKVGHAGTLDPFAEGVLVLCVGPATRLALYVQQQAKRYLAEITLGAVSTTEDAEGEITAREVAAWPPEQAAREVLARFVGEISQVPPAHSAVHVDGERAYRLARAGADLTLRPRTVHVHSIELLQYRPPRLEIDVACGSGTYIRALARDVGEALGVGGYCSRLCRTAVGAFTIDSAVRPEELDPARDLLDAALAVRHLPKITVDEDGAQRLRRGMRIDVAPAQRRDIGPEGAATAIFDGDGQFIAIAELRGTTLQPSKVFVVP